MAAQYYTYFSLEIIKKNGSMYIFFFEIRKTYGATQNGFFQFNLSAYKGPDAFDTEFGLKKNCTQAPTCIYLGILRKIFHHFKLVTCESHVFGASGVLKPSFFENCRRGLENFHNFRFQRSSDRIHFLSVQTLAHCT